MINNFLENPNAQYEQFMIPEYPLKGCKVTDPNEVIV